MPNLPRRDRSDPASDLSWLHRQARRLLGPRLRRRLDSQDLVQEAQLRAEGWRDKDFPNDAARRAWLKRLLRNVAAGEGRRRRSVELDGTWGRLPGEDPTPSRIAERAEESRNAEACLRALPEREQQVVRMRIVEGLPFATVAERVGITEVHARVLFHRTVQGLRERLDRDGDSAG